MSLLKDLSKKAWFGPLALFIVLGIALALSNRPAIDPNGIPIISGIDQYNEVLKEAESLSRNRFEAADSGQELTDEDRTALHRAALLFDAMNSYQPTKMGSFIGAGKAYQLTGELETAEERFRQCIANAQYDTSEGGQLSLVEAKYLTSRVRFEKHDYTSAYSLADEAVKAVPNAPNYLAARAAAAIQLQRIDQAKLDVDAALALDPNHIQASLLERLLKASEKVKMKQ